MLLMLPIMMRLLVTMKNATNPNSHLIISRRDPRRNMPIFFVLLFALVLHLCPVAVALRLQNVSAANPFLRHIAFCFPS